MLGLRSGLALGAVLLAVPAVAEEVAVWRLQHAAIIYDLAERSQVAMRMWETTRDLRHMDRWGALEAQGPELFTRVQVRAERGGAEGALVSCMLDRLMALFDMSLAEMTPGTLYLVWAAELLDGSSNLVPFFEEDCTEPAG